MITARQACGTGTVVLRVFLTALDGSPLKGTAIPSPTSPTHAGDAPTDTNALLCVEVRDDGPGPDVADVDIPVLFEPFYSTGFQGGGEPRRGLSKDMSVRHPLPASARRPGGRSVDDVVGTVRASYKRDAFVRQDVLVSGSQRRLRSKRTGGRQSCVLCVRGEWGRCITEGVANTA
jgi:hypothetical protein